jgi:GntR family transcriptional regulator
MREAKVVEYAGRPLYLEIADDLRRDIVHGKIPGGQKLPSIGQLSAEYGTSTTTVRQAIQVLRNEGHVIGQQGRGTFVRESRERHTRVLGDLYGRRAESSPMRVAIETTGAAGTWEHATRRTAASPPIAARLAIEPGAPVMKTDYRFLADGEPVMLSTSFEPFDLTRGTEIEMPEEGDRTGVVARFDSIGIRIDFVVEKVTARMPAPTEGQALRVPNGVPVMAVERSYLASGKPVETADIVVAGDNYVLVYGLPIR